MRASLPKPFLGSVSSIKLNDCWRKIGVWGNRECSKLKKVIHCRNCAVYSSEATQLLDTELPLDYLKAWTAHFASAPKIEQRPRQAVLVFRIGSEWLALSPNNLQEIAECGMIHSLPQRRSKALLGLVNIRGELLICVALDRVLGLEQMGPPKSNSQRAFYPRMVVAGRNDSRFVFPVEEVHGLYWFDPNELKGVPATIPKVPADDIN